MTGFCIAAESPGYVVYVQGGDTTITNGSDGMMELTVKDIIPYLSLANDEKRLLLPIDRLTNETYPVNAALLFSSGDAERGEIVEVSNLSLSDEFQTLTLQVKPLDFYEGNELKSFATSKNQESQGTIEGETNYEGVGIYLEISGPIPENTYPNPLNCIERCLAEKFGRTYDYCESVCKKLPILIIRPLF